MRKRIYIAGPMTLGDRVENLAQAIKAMKELIEKGFAPLCPQLTFFTEPFIKQDHQVWLDVDLAWVPYADALLRLPGVSRGADQETECACEHNIPCFARITDIIYHFKGKDRQ